MFWKKKKVEAPVTSPPIEFSEHFFVEWGGEFNQPWVIFSTRRVLDSTRAEDTQVFLCWTKEDAIALMKRLDKLVNERAAMKVKS